ncbi:MAG: endonuclease [Candidatus Eremiobacteraeota bacterium]|nr:endonuclease [Candidatus Eremiobacteraeota bacterium]
MNTKHRGDIAEQAATLEGLKRGWGVLRPFGDNLPYDLVFDVDGRFIKVQVKYGWLDAPSQNYVVDNRRTKTNRRQMVREVYRLSDFDFALVYLLEKNIFYVYPVNVFISFGSEIHMVETDKRQRRPRSAAYRDAWNLIAQGASQEEISVRTPVKLGEAVSRVIPNQALSAMPMGTV